MAMKLKVDENGNAELKDGLPVYVHDDGKEIPFDAPAAMAKIAELNGESKGHRLKAEDAMKRLKAFDGIEDPAAAIKAMQTVKNLDDKKLVDAGEIDTLKRQMSEVFDTEKGKLMDAIAGKDAAIRKLLVSSQFAKSPLISEKTILPADIAETYFGKHFRVEDHNGATRVVGYIGDEPIYSRVKAGELADFEEALSVIFDSYPQKDRIFKGGNAGSGAQNHAAAGGQNPSGKKRSEMTSSEKAKYIGEHGLEAFKQLAA